MDVVEQVADGSSTQLCSLCGLLPFFTPKAGNSEWDLGMLSSIQTKASLCAFCSFVKQTVNSFAPGLVTHDQARHHKVEDSIKVRLIEINDRSKMPWYKFAGIDVSFHPMEPMIPDLHLVQHTG